ncbi:MAG TPA: ATP-binding protein [Pyrinomonadaceae bacterium]|nr:ATP-binding protein [Pyrinomonadaceae bacterium]
MGIFRLLNSFRVRLLLVLAGLLVATLGVQFYLNRLSEQQVARTVAEQEQALAAGISLATLSFNTPERLEELDRARGFLLREKHAGRITNVLVVKDEGGVPNRLDDGDLIDDSLDPKFIPERREDGTVKYFNVDEAQLPRLVYADQSASTQPVAGEPRAFTISAATSKGLNYIIVVLGSAQVHESHSLWQDARPLLPTLAVLLIATLAAGILVWRFTRPIQELSDAARRVAAGDFNFRVPSATRRDEMGELAAVFNEMIARLGTMRDLETRLNLAERSAVVGRLASAIAHEIRNPLNYINLTLDHLRTSLAPNDPQKRAMVERLTAQLKTEVARINTRISEFLKYTRPAQLEMRPINLREAVEDALRIVEAQAAESNIETRLEAAGDIPPVRGDAESLRSIFTNLIINAVQAMEGRNGAEDSDAETDGVGGRLTITLSAEDGRARVSIADTGGGIEAENVSQVFEPYFSTKETGTGLGLAIVKKAVDDHDGTINVESTHGVGTTFTITLPTEERSEVRG